MECRPHLHGDFDGGQLPILVAHDANCGDIADIHAAQADRRTDAQAAGVVHVRFQSNLLDEEAATAHQKNQDGERSKGDQHRDPDFQLRPLQLFLARHAFSPAPCSPFLCRSP